jgi:hypothetical protein
MVHYKIYNIVVDLPLDVSVQLSECHNGEHAEGSRSDPRHCWNFTKKFFRGGASHMRMVKSEAFNFPLFGILLILLLGNMPVRCDGREK